MARRVYVLLIAAVFVFCITVLVSCREKGTQSPFQSELPVDNTTITVVPDSEVSNMAEPVVIEQGDEKLGELPPQLIPVEKEEVASGAFVAPTPEEIQNALSNAGYYNGSIDGKIGPKSKKAITDFQIDNSLEADGKVGPKTWAKLKTYLKK